MGFPVQPKSPYPWSSVITITILGLLELTVASLGGDFLLWFPASLLALAACATSKLRQPERPKASVNKKARKRFFLEFISKKGLRAIKEKLRNSSYQ